MTEPTAPSAKPVEPKPAATIMLLRDGAGGLEVLLLEKAPGKHFASGALVFPGGRVEPQDVAFDGAIGEERNPLSTFKIAAVRETYEECGIMLGRRPGAKRLMGAAEAAACRDADPSASFLGLTKSAPFELATDGLVRFAHWITPPFRSKRFDTHFFLASAPAGQTTARVDGHEIVDAAWHRPLDILDEAHAGTLKLVLPTMMNLVKLSNRRTVDEALATARADKVVCVEAKRIETDEGTQLCIPAEAGYGVTTIPLGLIRRA